MQSWYLLYCKRGQLQRAQEHLERQAVNCLAPMITLEKIVRGKRTAVSEPLFPNYLFVEFDPEVIHTTTINATRGVSHFVRFGSGRFDEVRKRSRFITVLPEQFHGLIKRGIPVEHFWAAAAFFYTLC